MLNKRTGSYIIQVKQIARQGSTWIVRVYRKRWWMNKRLASDWFLDRSQAQRFADDLKATLEANPNQLITRQPGWTLARPD
jgi:hypothetical protein